VDTPTIWPIIRCDNTRIVIDFLVTTFGFHEQLVVPTKDGEGVLHAQLRWSGGGGVMLGDRVRDNPAHMELPDGPISVYVVTDQPDELYRRAVEADAEIIRGLNDEDYGSRGFSATDPEGNVWSFGTYVGG
tara:strand:- start:176 stop:568 length:393 start_codon:yes stop_codon:yes gene_type:complete